MPSKCHRAIVEVVREEQRAFSGDPYGQPGVAVHVAEARAFAARAGPRYDLVRRIHQDGARYFGPYASASQARATLAFLGRACGLHELRAPSVTAVPMIALTATATPPVVAEMVRSLELAPPVRHVGEFARPNLRFEVEHHRSDATRLRATIAACEAAGPRS